MHELGVIKGMLKSIEQVMLNENLSKVGKIVLTVGELSGVIPAYIEECYPAAVYKTQFEGTELELDLIPGLARCNICGAEFKISSMDLKCPNCGKEDSAILSGREFILKEIHAY